MDSPAISTASFSDEEDLEAYLASYVPLSTLPTPPPVKERDLSDLSAISMHEAVVLTPDLAGKAHISFVLEVVGEGNDIGRGSLLTFITGNYIDGRLRPSL